MQEQIQKGSGSSSEDDGQLQELLDRAKMIKETKTTRTVYFKYHSTCGCGSATYAYSVDVPVDSPYQNGDTLPNHFETATYKGVWDSSYLTK